MRAARRVREGARGKRPVATPAPRPRAYLTTALREAKAPLRGAGPGTGPMLRSGSPDLVRQELAAWAAGTGMTRGVVRDAALAAAPARKGRRAGLAVRPRDLSFARALRAVLSAIRLGNSCYQAVTSEIAELPEYRRPGPAPRPQVQVPVILPARDREGHRHPHRPRHHHHGQHPRLTSGNIANPPAKNPVGPWTRPSPARHAALRHARQKGTTRSNQKRELPTTGQTPKFKPHGIALSTPVQPVLVSSKPDHRRS